VTAVAVGFGVRARRGAPPHEHEDLAVRLTDTGRPPLAAVDDDLVAVGISGCAHLVALRYHRPDLRGPEVPHRETSSAARGEGEKSMQPTLPTGAGGGERAGHWWSSPKFLERLRLAAGDNRYDP